MAELTLPEQTLNHTIKSQIDLMRLSVNTQKEVVKLLDEMNKEIVGEIAKIDPAKPKLSKWRKNRLLKLQKQSKEIIGSTYKEIDNTVNKDLFDMSGYIANDSVGVLNTAIGTDIFDVTYTSNQLHTIVNNSLIDGETIGDWWKDQSLTFQKNLNRTMVDVTNQIAIGVLKGDSIGELTKRVKGTPNITGLVGKSKNAAKTLVRTGYMQVASDIRMKTYEDFSDVLRGYQYVATLDNRTTAYCRAADGHIYDMNFKPVGHSFPLIIPPAHFNCFIDPQVPIYTSKGNKPIGKIKVGDLVLTHKGRFRKVTELLFNKSYEKPNMVKIWFEDNFLDLTDNHPILINEYWENAKNIKVGDKISIIENMKGGKCNFIESEVIKINHWTETVNRTLYNFSVEEDESYIAKGVVVHNCRSTMIPLTKTWSELSGPNSPLTKKQIKQIDEDTTTGERMSMGGRLSKTVNYNQWLKDQPLSVQQDVLGIKKQELWKKNKLTMPDLVNQDGRPLTIKQLETKYGKINGK